MSLHASHLHAFTRGMHILKELAKSSIVMGSYYIIFCKDDIKYRDIKDHCFDSWGKTTKHV